MSFIGMKLLSHLMKLLHLMTLPSQQFCLCGTLFNVHDTLMKYALRLAIVQLQLVLEQTTGPVRVKLGEALSSSDPMCTNWFSCFGVAVL